MSENILIKNKNLINLRENSEENTEEKIEPGFS